MRVLSFAPDAGYCSTRGMVQLYNADVSKRGVSPDPSDYLIARYF
jgi:hypothetical protein